MNNEKLDKMIDIIDEDLMELNLTDINNIATDLQSRMLQKILNTERDIFLKNQSKDKNNKANGHSSINKKIKTKTGEINISMPRDRNGDFEPMIIKKRSRVIEDFSDTALLLYAKGNSLSDISDIIKDIYKINLSKSYISDLISNIDEDIKNWQNKPLKNIYPFLTIDCLYCNVKKDGISTKVAIYVILGINIKGYKEILGIWIGDGSESSHFWCAIFEEIKDRGVEDILYISMDGLVGLTEAIETVFPYTKIQRCIVHLTRNIFKICNRKDAKNVITDYKKIYTSASLGEAEEQYQLFRKKYSNNKLLMKKIDNQIDCIYSLFSETEEIRKLIYTTNSIESINSSLRRVTNGKGAFINNASLIRVLFLRVQSLEKKWTYKIKNWDSIIESLCKQYEERIIKYITLD